MIKILFLKVPLLALHSYISNIKKHFKQGKSQDEKNYFYWRRFEVGIWQLPEFIKEKGLNMTTACIKLYRTGTSYIKYVHCVRHIRYPTVYIYDVTENTFINLKFRISDWIILLVITTRLSNPHGKIRRRKNLRNVFLLFYGCSTTFRGPQNSRFMTLTDGGADTVIDIKGVLQIWI